LAVASRGWLEAVLTGKLPALPAAVGNLSVISGATAPGFGETAGEETTRPRPVENRFHFLGSLSELRERFGARLYAYVLMDNHSSHAAETPEDNLSRAGDCQRLR
jgi:hypothetical protein